MTISTTVAAQTGPPGTNLDLVTLDERAYAIAGKIQCPVCEGQAITESNATIAKQMRVVVQEKVDAGWTEQEILDFFVERYGSFVLREPPFRGIAAGVWLAPPAIALFAILTGLLVVWRRRDRLSMTEPVVSDARDETVVNEELARYQRGEGS
ncbi:MAG: cytochrome c-type biogenesis protein CcmH [Chloroflexi bacterium]|nr:cytochrome c-type biogenesis protein CcmH [Chloroflexota bacterium]